MPSSSGTPGSYLSRVFALVMSAQVAGTSPGWAGRKLSFAFAKFVFKNANKFKDAGRSRIAQVENFEIAGEFYGCIMPSITSSIYVIPCAGPVAAYFYFTVSAIALVKVWIAMSGRCLGPYTVKNLSIPLAVRRDGCMSCRTTRRSILRRHTEKPAQAGCYPLERRFRSAVD